MKHSSIVIFDNALRKAWYSTKPFPLSAGLFASSCLKLTTHRVYQQEMFK